MSPGLCRRDADQIDGDAAALDQQAGNANSGAGRRLGEKLLPALVEGEKVVEVGEEDLRLDDVVQRATGRGERVLQLRENVAGLLLDRRAVIRKGRVDPRLWGDPGLVRAGDLAG